MITLSSLNPLTVVFRTGRGVIDGNRGCRCESGLNQRTRIEGRWASGAMQAAAADLSKCNPISSC